MSTTLDLDLTSRCFGCGATANADQKFCAQCGVGRSALDTATALAPATAAGVVVAVLGYLAMKAVPIPNDSGFFGTVLAFVYSTTFPYFDVAFGLIGGWTAAVALAQPGVVAAAITGGAVGVAYPLAIVVAAQLGGQPVDAGRLALGGVLAVAGAVAGAQWSGPLGRMTKTNSIYKSMPGGGPVAAGLCSIIVVAAALAAYFVAAVAVVIALIGLALYVAFKIFGPKEQDSGSEGGAAAAAQRKAAGRQAAEADRLETEARNASIQQGQDQARSSGWTNRIEWHLKSAVPIHNLMFTPNQGEFDHGLSCIDEAIQVWKKFEHEMTPEDYLAMGELIKDTQVRHATAYASWYKTYG